MLRDRKKNVLYDSTYMKIPTQAKLSSGDWIWNSNCLWVIRCFLLLYVEISWYIYLSKLTHWPSCLCFGHFIYVDENSVFKKTWKIIVKIMWIDCLFPLKNICGFLSLFSKHLYFSAVLTLDIYIYMNIVFLLNSTLISIKQYCDRFGFCLLVLLSWCLKET